MTMRLCGYGVTPKTLGDRVTKPCRCLRLLEARLPLNLGWPSAAASWRRMHTDRCCCVRTVLMQLDHRMHGSSLGQELHAGDDPRRRCIWTQCETMQPLSRKWFVLERAVLSGLGVCHSVSALAMGAQSSCGLV